VKLTRHNVLQRLRIIGVLLTFPKCLYFVGGVLTKLIFRTVMEIGKAAADSYA
jgi:hypothetical protein